MADSTDATILNNRTLISSILAMRTPAAPTPMAAGPPQTGMGPATDQSVVAYLYAGGHLTNDWVVPWQGQDFSRYATPWEARWSALVVARPKAFTPVVQQISGRYAAVVGHIGTVNGSQLFAPRGKPYSGGRPSDILAANGLLFVSPDPDQYTPPDGWTEGFSDIGATVLATVDGQVIQVLASRTRGVEAEELPVDTVLDLIDAVKVLVHLGAAIGARLLPVLVRRTRDGVIRTELSGVGRALATSAAKAEEREVRVVIGTGYDPRMGIPSEHLTAMTAAAKETNVIAVFRANKPAAIPLIRQGAVGKPKALSVPGFKSSEATGVLTAVTKEQYDLVYKAGYYTVEADGLALRTVYRDGKPVVEKLKLTNRYWKMEKGQVIHASGHPVVGDYDLLGVIPLESPGRNITVVPKDLAKGDWLGPDVARYKDAVNRQMREERVLHGAQDQFHNPQWGGFTDDTAYAVFPDGRTAVMSGKAEQEAFYNMHGRQTAVGSYNPGLKK